MGTGKLIDPSKLAKVFVSPRSRAQRTFDLVFKESGEKLREGKVEVTERIAEWSYGLYEGMLTKDIRAARKGRGLDQEREWDIWRDGCEEGE